jgi:hypothetical protein
VHVATRILHTAHAAYRFTQYMRIVAITKSPILMHETLLLLTHKQAQNPNFNLKKVLKVGYEMYQMYNKNNATPMQLGEYAAKSLGFDIKNDGLKTLKGLF